MKKVILNIINDDFKDFIESLNKYDVDFIVIGGYAVELHGITAPYRVRQ